MATLGEQPSQQDPRRDAVMGGRRMHGDGELQEHSTRSLFSELIAETTALIRAEIALARGEMLQHARSAQRGVTSMAAGAAVLNAGLLALVASAVLALRTELADWAAALVVGVIAAAIGAIMLAVGKRKAAGEGMKPERTLHSLTEMKDMARDERQRAARKWQ